MGTSRLLKNIQMLYTLDTFCGVQRSVQKSNLVLSFEHLVLHFGFEFWKV